MLAKVTNFASFDIYLLNSDKYFLVDSAMFSFLVATPRLANHPLLPHQLLEQHPKGDLHQGVYDYIISTEFNIINCVSLVGPNH